MESPARGYVQRFYEQGQEVVNFTGSVFMPFFSRLAKFLSRNIFAVIGVLLMISSITVLGVSLITSGALDGVPVAQHEKSINQIFGGLIFVGVFLILAQLSGVRNKGAQKSWSSTNPTIKSDRRQIKTSMPCPACGKTISFWRIAFGVSRIGLRRCPACKATLVIESSRTRKVASLALYCGLALAIFMVVCISRRTSLPGGNIWGVFFIALLLFLFIGDTLYKCNRETLVRIRFNYESPKSVKTEPYPATTVSVKPLVLKVEDKVILNSPVQGRVLSINAKIGDKVTSGSVLLVLEAMDTEYNISAPQDGLIKEIFVLEGRPVQRDEPLMALKE